MMDSMRRSIDDMRERAARQGRQVRIAFNPFVAFGDSREVGNGRGHEVADAGRARCRYAQDGVEGRAFDACRLRGDAGRGPGQRLAAYQEMGIELVLLQYVPTPENAMAIGRELIAPLQ